MKEVGRLLVIFTLILFLISGVSAVWWNPFTWFSEEAIAIEDCINITESGNYYLAQDILDASPFCINISANDVNLDLNGKSITSKYESVVFIDSCSALQNISKDLTGYYVLTKDIDCSGFNFIPLGTFSGVLEGNGYRIFNISIVSNYYLNGDTGQSSLTDYNLGIIKNLGIVNPNIIARYETAAFARRNEGLIEKSYVSGFGRIYSFGYWTAAGGIARYNSGKINNCYSAISVSANPGYASPSQRRNNAGVLVAYNQGIINNSYVLGVSNEGWDPRAGISAYVGGNSLIQNSFSINSSESLVFESLSLDTQIKNSASGGSCLILGNASISDCLENKSSSYFKNKNNAPLNSWDFDNIWDINSSINNGYPYLRSTGLKLDSAIIVENVNNINITGFGNITGFPNQINLVNSEVNLADFDKIKYFEFRNSFVGFYHDSASLKYLQPINVKTQNANFTLGNIISVANKSIDLNTNNYPELNQQARLVFGFKIKDSAIIRFNGVVAPAEWYNLVSSDPFILEVRGFELCKGEIIGANCAYPYQDCVYNPYNLWYDDYDDYTCSASYAFENSCRPVYSQDYVGCSNNRRCVDYRCVK